MKNLYKRTCCCVVDGWICEGYMDKYGFHIIESNWKKCAYKIPWKIKCKLVFIIMKRQ